MIEILNLIPIIIAMLLSVILLFYGFESKSRKAAYVYFGLLLISCILFTLHLMAHRYGFFENLLPILKIEYILYLFIPPLLSYAASEIFSEVCYLDKSRMNYFFIIAGMLSTIILLTDKLFIIYDPDLIKLKQVYSSMFLAYYLFFIALSIWKFNKEKEERRSGQEFIPFVRLSIATILLFFTLLIHELLNQTDRFARAMHYAGEISIIACILFIFYIVFEYKLMKIERSIYVFLIAIISLMIIAGLMSVSKDSEDDLKNALLREINDRQSDMIFHAEKKIHEFFLETGNALNLIERSLAFEGYLKDRNPETKTRLSARLDEPAEHNEFSICYFEKNGDKHVCSSGFGSENLTRVDIGRYLKEERHSGEMTMTAPFIESGKAVFYLRKQVKKNGVDNGFFLIRKNMDAFEEEFEDREVSPRSENWMIDESGLVLAQSNHSIKFRTIEDISDGSEWIDESTGFIEKGEGIVLATKIKRIEAGNRTWYLGIGTPADDITGKTDELIKKIRNSSLISIILIFAISFVTIIAFIKYNKTLKSEIERKTHDLRESERKIESYANNLEKKNMDLSGKISELEMTKKAMLNLLKDIKDSNEKLKSLDDMKTDFMNISSHELKTPLISIMGYSELLAEKQMDEESKKMISIIWRNSQRLKNLVTDIITISKLESGELSEKNIELDMKEVIDEIMEEISSVAKRKEIALAVDTDRIKFFGDKALINQLIVNLLNNAVKFTQNGGKVSLEIKEKGDEIYGKVSDTGIGIPPDKISSLFQKFYQVDSSRDRKYGGSGLGLSICKKVIERYHGKIWVESVVGEGTTFQFVIPKSRKQ